MSVIRTSPSRPWFDSFLRPLGRLRRSSCSGVRGPPTAGSARQGGALQQRLPTGLVVPAAMAMRFELAAVYRDKRHAIEKVREGQRIVTVERGSGDVVGLFREGPRRVEQAAWFGRTAEPLRKCRSSANSRPRAPRCLPRHDAWVRPEIDRDPLAHARSSERPRRAPPPRAPTCGARPRSTSLCTLHQASKARSEARRRSRRLTTRAKTTSREPSPLGRRTRGSARPRPN